MVKVYLGICCLKRPFDDQSQARIAVETAAVLAVLKRVDEGSIVALRSEAHELENQLNTDPRRAKAVAEWLAKCPPPPPATPEEARANIQDAGRFHLEGLREDGLPVPPPAAVAA